MSDSPQSIQQSVTDETEVTRSVAREWFTHLGQGQIDEALALCADGIEFINYEPIEGFNTRMTWIGTYVGKREVRDSFERFASVVEVLSEELTKLVVEKDTAVGFVHELSRVRSTGKTFEIQFVQELTVQYGQIVRWKSYTDPSPILRALT